MEAGAGLGAESDEEESGASINEDSSANSSRSSMSCDHSDNSEIHDGAAGAEDESDGDVLLSDASVAPDESFPDESFPDDDAWNQYHEDEELDAEVRFREFEELLDFDERKLQYTSTATTYN